MWSFTTILGYHLMWCFIIVTGLYNSEGRWWQWSRRGFFIHLIFWRIEVRHFCCSIEGLQPSLSLLTRDGALLSDDDPVLLVVGSEEVMSTVISWNIPPLTDRYMEACQFLHSGIVSSWPYREHCVCVYVLMGGCACTFTTTDFSEIFLGW